MLLLEDVININKVTDPFEVENFFILMEVYGETPELATFINRVYDHTKQRKLSKENVEAFLVNIQQAIDKLTEL